MIENWTALEVVTLIGVVFGLGASAVATIYGVKIAGAI